ncbi:MAG: hypothetical protein ACI4RJ_01985 [Alphaproteobacteria bacterium]
MKKIVIALLIACACVSACSSTNDAAATKTRSSAVETLPAENK